MAYINVVNYGCDYDYYLKSDLCNAFCICAPGYFLIFSLSKCLSSSQVATVSYLFLSMTWQMMSGARRNRLLLAKALSVCTSIWWMGMTSPSGVVVFLTTCNTSEASGQLTTRDGHHF